MADAKFFNGMIAKRLLAILAILMIGEGMVALLQPARYMRLWKFGPRSFQETMEELAANSNITRSIAVFELALGFWLVLWQIRRR
jgi:hypothetical protein